MPSAELHDTVAAELAEQAGLRLLTLRERWAGSEAALRRAGDVAGQRFLAAALAQRFPDHAVRSEEARDPLDRERASYVWIIDPLDGTREYAE